MTSTIFTKSCGEGSQARTSEQRGPYISPGAPAIVARFAGCRLGDLQLCEVCADDDCLMRLL